jgi:hypothetical protein
LVHVSAGVGIFDARDGRTLAFVPATRIARPVEAIYAEHRFWVFDAAGPAFVEIDPRSRQVVQVIPSPVTDVGYFDVQRNDLWVADESGGSLVHLDVPTGRRQTISRLPGSGGTVGVAILGDRVWVTRPEALGGAGMIIAINTRSGRTEHVIRGLPGSYALAASERGTLWTAGTFGRVNEIDPHTLKTSSVDTAGRNFAVAWGGGFAWTVDTIHGFLYAIAPGARVASQTVVGAGSRSVAYAEGQTWVGNARTGMVTEVGADGSFATYRFDRPIQSLAAGRSVVLVAFAPRPT